MIDTERVAAIEAAFERHWRHFGGYPGASLRDEDGVLWFESPIRYLPYNWVIRTRIAEGADTEPTISRVAAGFRAREVPFMWVQRPSDRPTDLDRHPASNGFDLVETAVGMDLDFDGWQAQPNSSGAELRNVDAAGADEQGLRDYEELIRTYWSVPENERHMIEALNRHWTGARATRASGSLRTSMASPSASCSATPRTCPPGLPSTASPSGPKRVAAASPRRS